MQQPIDDGTASGWAAVSLSCPVDPSLRIGSSRSLSSAPNQLETRDELVKAGLFCSLFHSLFRQTIPQTRPLLDIHPPRLFFSISRPKWQQPCSLIYIYPTFLSSNNLSVLVSVLKGSLSPSSLSSPALLYSYLILQIITFHRYHLSPHDLAAQLSRYHHSAPTTTAVCLLSILPREKSITTPFPSNDST